MRNVLLTLACILLASTARAEPFEIKDGDRVLFLGDTLLEREGTYGYLETRMAEQFPDRRFTVRNLAFSADTPLGWSRASFDPAAKGFERLKEQLALVQPTVVFLGYGMAASLQEMTDRSQDWTLNRDAARYGAEPMSAARFKKELAQCMDAIVESGRAGLQPAVPGILPGTPGVERSSNPEAPTAKNPGGAQSRDEGKTTSDAPGSKPGAAGNIPALPDAHAVRFVLLSPIRHEDLRATRPGLPDPAEHNKLLEQYSKAIEELAKERGARFVSLVGLATDNWSTVPPVFGDPFTSYEIEHPTDNGIHLNRFGYLRMAGLVAGTLRSETPVVPAANTKFDEAIKHAEEREALRAAIIRKNELFFHRWRPANETYLFGFRKREQGQNSVEIPKFDPLIEQAEAEIDRLKKSTAAANPANGERRASGSAGFQPAVPGILPGTPGVEGSSNPETPTVKNPGGAQSRDGRKTTSDAPGRIPSAAGNIPALPGNAAQSATGIAATMDASARQTPALTPDLSKIPANATFPHPTFTVADGLEISLWGENPLLAKPTQMNWDAQGRLWVASSAMYPMIAPGQVAFDKILILEDPGHTGAATKSTVFVDGLLIPTGVAPVLVDEGSAQSSVPSAQKDAAATPSPLGTDAPGTEQMRAQKVWNRKRSARISTTYVKTSGGYDAKQTVRGLFALTSEHSTRPARFGCYVGQSTELLYFEDTDGDGKADKKRIVFSGFGTEDTHHIVHTLRWGPDGRLYFSQSVYIHTHLETPWGVVRVNSGGVFAYDPRTERVEVVARGLWNTWGHAWDKWGQSFFTDGAGSSGITWAFPGATFAPFEGSRRQMASISPGSYPKFAGLELIYSPHFPADWQGSAVTCDFRAHKIVHFKISDLGFQISDLGATGVPATTGAQTGSNQKSNPPIDSTAATPNQKSEIRNPKSGYITEQLPVLVQTGDATFRPIDVKLGPDGALYIADWSNPIINHGEVDFRDPRRDHEHGRIWRLSVKGGAAVKWESLAGKKVGELVAALTSGNGWERANAQQVLIQKAGPQTEEMWGNDVSEDKTGVRPALVAAVAGKSSEAIAAAWGVARTINFDHFHEGPQGRMFQAAALGESSEDDRWRALGTRRAGEWLTRSAYNFDSDDEAVGTTSVLTDDILPELSKDKAPRVRVEAMRALARMPSEKSASLILDAAVNAPKDDPYYEFAAWLSINDLAPQVAEWVEKNSADTASEENARDSERASGRAGLQPAVPGILPGTPGVERSPQPDTPPSKNPGGAQSRDEGKTTSDAPGSKPGAAGNIPALPGTSASAVTTPKSRDAKITLALQSLPPEASAPLLSKILAKRALPRDGSGPWIDLIGTAGGPAELRLLLAALLAATTPDGDNMKPLADAKHQFKTPDANRRAAAALVAAARRGVKPAGDAAGELAPWQFYMHAPTDALPDVLRLAGLWKQNFPGAMIAALDTRASAPVLDAAFESLRTLATPEAADFLTAYFDPAVQRKLDPAALSALQRVVAKSDTNWRTHALVALAALRPNEAMKHLPGVLAESGEPGHLQLWRDLFASQPFIQRFSQAVPKDLPPTAYATALRVAREMGRKGEGLAAKLSPLAGVSTAATTPANYTDLAARAKKDGDPVAGEALYRRMASACTTCHAIGGAGGKLGPDMTSIGASAPPDYIIESLLNPAAKVKEGYHAFSITMKDGSEMIGIPTRETAQEQFIRTLAGEQGLPKTNIVSKKIMEGGASLMPAGLTAAWTDRERLNLYAFLGELGRPGPFDASKNNVARMWQLTDSAKVDGALKPDPNAIAIPAYTLVDGRLTKDLLAEKLAMLQPKNDTVHLTANFQSATSGKARLNLTGIRKAWLDGQPLAIASEPSPSVDLAAGAHTFTIEVDVKTPPEVVRIESPAVSFLGD